MSTYKIVIVGASHVGKTPFVMSLLPPAGNVTYPTHADYLVALLSLYKSNGYTIGVEVHPFRINTNHGDIVLNLWDCGGKYTGANPDIYYTGADGAIGIYSNDIEGSRNVAVEKINKMVEITGNNKYVVASKEEDGDDYYIADKNKIITDLLVQLTGHNDIEIV